MEKRKMGEVVRVVLAVGCFIMAGLSVSGVVSRGGGNERLVFGIGWTLIGVGWLVRWYVGRKRARQEPRKGSEL